VKILFDGPFDSSPKAGVVLYFKQLAQALYPSCKKIYFSRRQFLSSSEEYSHIKLPFFSHFRPHKISFSLEKIVSRLNLRGIPDILHPTEFDLSPTGTFFHSKGSKVVITIHDLIHEKFGGSSTIYNPKRRFDYYSTASGFIFVSNSTRKDFAKYYPSLYESRPSKVIWHGCNFPIQATAYPKKKQFLFVGSRDGYKNFPNACNAFENILKIDEGCNLAIVGSPPNSAELKMVEKFKSQVIWVRHPSHETLEKFYAESIGLLYVSTYEGFGMPLLEAMSRGCVPIAGNHSSIPEVLGEAGIMVNVKDPSDISNAMKRCLKNSNLISDVVEKGFKRSQTFSWKKSAEETLSFYESL
jgi:glycosyltransferase involved in cell wall biosynthesis